MNNIIWSKKEGGNIRSIGTGKIREKLEIFIHIICWA
jgi:hypothetical protein